MISSKILSQRNAMDASTFLPTGVHSVLLPSLSNLYICLSHHSQIVTSIQQTIPHKYGSLTHLMMSQLIIIFIIIIKIIQIQLFFTCHILTHPSQHIKIHPNQKIPNSLTSKPLRSVNSSLSGFICFYFIVFFSFSIV